MATSYFQPGSVRKVERRRMMQRCGRAEEDSIHPGKHHKPDIPPPVVKVFGQFATKIEDLKAKASVISRRTLFDIELQLGFARGTGPTDPSDPEFKDWDYDAIRQFRKANAKYDPVTSPATDFDSNPCSDADESDGEQDSLDGWEEIKQEEASAPFGPEAYMEEDSDDGIIVGEFSLGQLRHRLIAEHQEDIALYADRRLKIIQNNLMEDYEKSRIIESFHNLLWYRLLYIYGDFHPTLRKECDRLNTEQPEPKCFLRASWAHFLEEILQERERFSKVSGRQDVLNRELRACWINHHKWLGHRSLERQLAVLTHEVLRLGCHKVLLTLIWQWLRRDSCGLARYGVYVKSYAFAGLAHMTGRDLTYLHGVCPTRFEGLMRKTIREFQAATFEYVRAVPLPREAVDGEIEPRYEFKMRVEVMVPWPMDVNPAKNFAYELERMGMVAKAAVREEEDEKFPLLRAFHGISWDGRLAGLERKDNKLAAVACVMEHPERRSKSSFNTLLMGL